MAQSILLSSVFCYVTIAAIVARPLPIDIVKRQNTNRQMEDIQLSEKGIFQHCSTRNIGVATDKTAAQFSNWDGGTRPIICKRFALTEAKFTHTLTSALL